MKREYPANGPHRAEEFGLDPRVCWGVFVGDCVAKDATWRTAREEHAHAHNFSEDEWQGWICIVDRKRVVTAKGRPTVLLTHEYAHLLVPNAMHNAKWKQEMVRLGCKVELSKYERRPRRHDRTTASEDRQPPAGAPAPREEA